MKSSVILVVFFVYCVVCNADSGKCNADSGKDALLRVIEERLEVKSISLDMKIITPIALPGREEYKDIIRSYKIEMIPSENLFRQVQDWKSPFGSRQDILLKNKSGYIEDKGGVVNANLTAKDVDGIFVDVRLFGLVPSNPSSLIGRLSKETVDFLGSSIGEETDADGDNVIDYTLYRLASDKSLKIWFSKEMSMNPVRLRFDFSGKYSEQVDTTYAYHGPVHGWFPSKVRYRQFNNAGIVDFEEIAELNNVIFDKVEQGNFETGKLPFVDGRRLIADGGVAKRFNVGTGKFEDSSPTDAVDLVNGTYIRLGSTPTARPYRWAGVLFFVSLTLVIVVALRLFIFRQKFR